MDCVRGGDLISGMQAHWQAKGKIPLNASVSISSQMAASISYLHGRYIVHRDIKGDNFLCSVPDISNLACAITLTDFGTSLQCQPGERLNEKCGTKLYWSPEFYKLNYSLKVDIWAMGIIVYGLLSACFLFRNEKDVNNKVVKVPKGTPRDFEAFVLKVLERDEEARVDHLGVMAIHGLKMAQMSEATSGVAAALRVPFSNLKPKRSGRVAPTKALKRAGKSWLSAWTAWRGVGLGEPLVMWDIFGRKISDFLTITQLTAVFAMSGGRRRRWTKLASRT
jgi:serine/threonine protein kinase